MRSRIATLALAGTLGVTGVATAALVAPAASYAATGDSTALADRVASLKDALAGLVTDGTLTQAQADRVASSLAESPALGRHGGPGGRRGGRIDVEAAAEALGITVEELRAAGAAGTTLAELAEREGVSEEDLVAALVAAEEARLAEAVTAGRLTQEQADERLAGAEERITAALDDPACAGGRGGPGRGGRGPADAGSAPSQTPSQTPSDTSTSTTSSAA